MKNGEGYNDPTPAQAMWGIRQEEKIRFLEKKHGVYRGDIVTLQDTEQTEHRIPGEKRTIIRNRKMKVVSINTHHITLEYKGGLTESYQWQEFHQKRR